MKNLEPITIVTGLPRSGTSLMMQMLAAGGLPILTDGIRAADEDNPQGYYEFEPVKKTQHDSSWLRHAAGKGVKLVYRLLYDLPADRDYRVVFMRRELAEVLASQRKMLGRNGTRDSPGDDEQLAELFRRELAEFENWLANRPRMTTVQISYNALLRDPSGPLESLNRLCGGTLNTAAMAAVVDQSLYRNRS